LSIVYPASDNLFSNLRLYAANSKELFTPASPDTTDIEPLGAYESTKKAVLLVITRGVAQPVTIAITSKVNIFRIFIFSPL
ncbi:MAG: hypothetical protein WAT53_07545, partial [Nitrosomonas sp.]